MDNKNYQDIDKYIREDMNVEEAKQFDEQLQQDTALQEEVELYGEITKVVAARDFIEDLQREIESERETEKQKKVPIIDRLRVRRVLAYAASVGILFIAGAVPLANMKYSNTRLASIDEIQSTLRSDQTNAGAMSWLAPVSSKLENEDYDGAIKDLQEVITTNTDQNIRENAEWFLLKAKLANNELDTDFTNLLQSIANNPTHLHHPNAKLLQKDLNSVWRKLVW